MDGQVRGDKEVAAADDQSADHRSARGTNAGVPRGRESVLSDAEARANGDPGDRPCSIETRHIDDTKA
jgi:hypothetical protein